MSAPLPYGWEKMIDARRREGEAFNHHARPLFLLVGESAPQSGSINLRVRPGKDFNWSALMGLYVVVKPALGVDPFPVVRSIFGFVAGWPAIMSEGDGLMMSVVRLVPTIAIDVYTLESAAQSRARCDAYYSKHPFGVIEAQRQTNEEVEF